MSAEMFERALALVGALLVGGTASYQLKNELAARGLDALVTKFLLGLMIIGCVFAALASIHLMGDFK
jgi:hypothetical protein